MMTLPPGRMLLEPEGGWKERTHYVVDVAFNEGNPIHRRILYVGFLNGAKGRPLSGGYTCLLCDATGEDGSPNPEQLYYLNPVCEIPEMEDG